MLQIPRRFCALSDAATAPASAPPSTAALSPRWSRYAAQLLAADPDLHAALAAPGAPTRAAMQARLAHWQTAAQTQGATREAALAAAMRRLKREVYLAVMEGDLRGALAVEQVTEAMTVLAEVTLDAACATHYALLQEAHGTPVSDPAEGPAQAQPFVVVGMGKLGGRELNVSSDIDLIFLYPGDGETAAGPGQRGLSNHEFFIRLGRRVIGAMSEVDAHGYVFRVDMRLRPNGDAGPLAASYAMLEEYFFVQGREWERYAWIKARVVAMAGGAPADGAADQADALRAAAQQRAVDELEALRRPFVFRKYLDYGAIAALRDLHRQIRAEVGKRAAQRPARGANVKLGRGGIREIEFIAQVFQLIRGGRMRKLQTRATCDVLALLADDGLMPRERSEDLRAAYGFLRALEHRLQYLDDAQTHSLPADDGDLDRIAGMMGLADAPALMAQLDTVQRLVADVFDHVFDTSGNGNGDTPRARGATDWFGEALADDAGVRHAIAALTERGLACPEEIARRLAALVRGSRYRALPEASRARLQQIVAPMLDFVATCTDQAAVAGRFIDLLETIARRSAYLALLAEYPAALARVGRMLAASPWAASYLNRHPILLDELLDERELARRPDWTQARAELEHLLADATLGDGQPDVERRMDILRETHHVWSFRLLAQDLDGQLSVEALADDLSALADLILDATLAQCWAQLPNKHRADPTFAVIAYGKLGGKELGYASDLDLVFVHDDAGHGGEHERSAEVYAKLAQRVLAWLTSHTSAGRLFEVDMRLRPNGNAGLLVISIESFAQYQSQRGSNSAWTWEHQALTRARFCAGHAPTGAKFEAIRTAVLRSPREPATLLPQIVEMRGKMHDGHPNQSALFDLKHDTGGMIDIEFIVQALVLLHAGALPELAENKGNIALLLRAGARGLLPEALAGRCADAYRVFRARQHALRLQAEGDAGPARIPPEELQDERAAVRAAWQHVFGAPACA